MNLEDDLRRALRRTPAPPRFADRVLSSRLKPWAPKPAEASAEAGRRRPAPTTEAAPTTPRLSWRRWLAAAAAVALLATGGTRYYKHQQMVAEAERIEADLRLALQITSEKLELVQRKVNDSSSNEVAR